MQVYGVDLAAWYADGRWEALIEYIDGLPAACRLNEAISNDPESAKVIANLPKPADPWSPKVSEFDLHANMLREIIHGLKALKQVSISAAGGTPGQEKPFPAPYTEIDRAIKAAERAYTESVASGFGFGPDDI